MEIEELIREAGETAKEKGWWSPPQTFGEFIALCHSELSEALEEYRSGETLYRAYYYKDTEKPEGIPIELADVVIRIFDFCHHWGIDLPNALRLKMDYNKTRSRKHGNKII